MGEGGTLSSKFQKCPCRKSDKQSWMLVCTSCKQGWHSACVNIKGKDVTRSFILALEEWLCSWCFEPTAPKPSTHPTFKTQQTLLATAVSDTVVTNVTDSIKNVTESITATIDNKLKSTVENALSETLTKIIGRE